GLNQCNTGQWRVQSFSLTSAATPTPTPTPNPCLTSTTAWQNQAIASATIHSVSPSFGLCDFFTGLWRTRAAGLQRSNSCLILLQTSTLAAACFLRSLHTPQSRSLLEFSTTT